METASKDLRIYLFDNPMELLMLLVIISSICALVYFFIRMRNSKPNKPAFHARLDTVEQTLKTLQEADQGIVSRLVELEEKTEKVAARLEDERWAMKQEFNELTAKVDAIPGRMREVMLHTEEREQELLQQLEQRDAIWIDRMQQQENKLLRMLSDRDDKLLKNVEMLLINTLSGLTSTAKKNN